MDPLLQLLISLIIWIVVIWLLFYVLSLVPLPHPARVLITVLVALVVLLYLLQRTNLLVGF